MAFCTAAFLLAQFWSFAAAATLLSDIDTDPRNDICLEDVISVDPFVGASGGSSRSTFSRGVSAAELIATPIFQVFRLAFLLSVLQLSSTEVIVSGYDLVLAPTALPVRQVIGKLQV